MATVKSLAKVALRTSAIMKIVCLIVQDEMYDNVTMVIVLLVVEDALRPLAHTIHQILRIGPPCRPLLRNKRSNNTILVYEVGPRDAGNKPKKHMV
jgi:hypothetical protein